VHYFVLLHNIICHLDDETRSRTAIQGNSIWKLILHSIFYTLAIMADEVAIF